MSHFPPPPQIPPKVGLFRRVPPAIFPAILGLLGLVAVWRRATEVFGVPQPFVDLAPALVQHRQAISGQRDAFMVRGVARVDQQRQADQHQFDGGEGQHR